MAKKSQKNSFEWIIRDVWNLFPNVKLSSNFMISGSNCNLLCWMPKDIYFGKMLLISLISPPRRKLSINYTLSLIDINGKECFVRKGWTQLHDETVLINIFQSRLKKQFLPNQKITIRLSWTKTKGRDACEEIQKQNQDKQEPGCSIQTREQATQTDVSQPLPTRIISTTADMEIQNIKVYGVKSEERPCAEDTEIVNLLPQEEVIVEELISYCEMHDVVEPNASLVTESLTNKVTPNASPLVSEHNLNAEKSKIKPTHDGNLEPDVSSINMKENTSPFKNKINKTENNKDVNERRESKEDGYVEMNDNACLETSSTPAPPPATVPVTQPVEKRAPSSIPAAIDSEISCPIPLPSVETVEPFPNDVSLSEATQSELLTPVSRSTKTEQETIFKNQSKFFLKYTYKEHQWSPLNPEGKRQYDRDLLLHLQSQPMSLCKPNNLPKLDVVKDKAHIHRLTTHQSLGPFMKKKAQGAIPKSPSSAVNTRSLKSSRRFQGLSEFSPIGYSQQYDYPPILQSVQSNADYDIKKQVLAVQSEMCLSSGGMQPAPLHQNSHLRIINEACENNIMTKTIKTVSDMEKQNINIYDEKPEDIPCAEDTRIDNLLPQEESMAEKLISYCEMHDVDEPNAPLVTESLTNKVTPNAIPQVSGLNVNAEESKIKATHDGDLEPNVSSIKIKENPSPIKNKTNNNENLTLTSATVSVTQPVEKRDPSPIPTVIDSEIMCSIPLPPVETVEPFPNDVSLSEPPQSQLLTPATRSTKTEEETILKNQSKLFFKYIFKEDQWSPLNPEGKRQYDRDFLLQLQSEPMSLCKPNDFPKLDVINDKAHIHPLTTVKPFDPFMPKYARGAIPKSPCPAINTRSQKSKSYKKIKNITDLFG